MRSFIAKSSLSLAIFCGVLLISVRSLAQFSNYTFTQNTTTSVYSAITSGTVAASGASLNEERYLITLPFTYNIDGVAYTQAYLCVNGYLAFGADPGSGQYYGIASPVSGFSTAAGMSTNLAGLNTGTELRYQTIGTAPNRTFVVQWKDFGYSGSMALTVNFQVRLSETTNNMSVVFGSCALTGSSNISVQSGLRGVDNSKFFHRYSNASDWTGTTTAASYNNSISYTSYFDPPSGLTYNFLAPAACTTPAAQPTALVLTASSTTSISGTFTAAAGGADKYLVVRTPAGTPLNTLPVDGTAYTAGSTLGNGTVVQASASTSFNSGGLTPVTTYTYTIFAYNGVGCMIPAYRTGAPLTGQQTTQGPRSYTWVPASGSGSWATATNWSPQRDYPNSSDTLNFSNGGNVTVTDLPNNTVGGLQVSNGTLVMFTNSYDNSLYIREYLRVDLGCTLDMAGVNSMKMLVAPSYTPDVVIDGTLIVSGNSAWFDYNNAYQPVVHGTVNVSGTNARFTSSCSGCYFRPVFAAGSRYNHQRNGGDLPAALYDPTSVTTITGMTTTSPTGATSTVDGALKLGKLVVNCPGMTADMTIGSVNGTQGDVVVKHTGIARFAPSYWNFYADFSQLKGNTQLTSVTCYGDMFLDSGATYLYGVNLRGDLTSTAQATVAATNNLTFNGNMQQHVSLSGTFPNSSAASFILANPAGAVLTGTFSVSTNSNVTINEGDWSGTGAFSYTGNAVLKYACSTSHTMGAVEWPATNGPQYVTVNMSGPAPYNRLTMTGTRTVSESLTLTTGVVTLGNYDLTMSSYDIPYTPAMSSPGRMIATNGAGRFFLNIAGGYVSAFYPIGDITGTVESSPVMLTGIGNASPRLIGIRVTDAQHPSDASATSYISRYWTLTDNSGTGDFVYTGSFSYTAADLVGSSNMAISAWDGSAWTTYPGGNADTMLTLISPLSTATYPLNGRAVTGRTQTATTNIYTWNGSISTDYTVAGNWTPTRTTPLPNDIIQFTSGGTNTVDNVPVQSVSQMKVFNNTTVNFYGANKALTIVADNNAATDELSIENGSALYLLSGTATNLKFNGSATAGIAGRLEIAVTYQFAGSNGILNLQNCVATVKPNGVLAAGTTTTHNPIISTASSLLVQGTYEHKFTTVGGFVPIAMWANGSTLLITGLSIVTSGNAPTGIHQSFYDLTYNCPSQSEDITWSGAYPDSVRGTFRMISTGFAKLRSESNPIGLVINKFIQTGGTMNLGGTYTPANKVVILDSLWQTGGTLEASSATNPTGATLLFAGTGGAQKVNLATTSPTGALSYRISNPAGVVLTGSGGLTALTINDKCGLYISTPATVPLNTSLTLQYSTVNTTLGFDTTSYTGTTDFTATPTIFPASNGPVNLRIIMGARAVNMALDRTVPGTLTLTSGAINLGSNTLTLGTAATSTGTLVWTQGMINVTSGSFKRWFTTSGLPATPGTAGLFPLAANGSRRFARIYFSGGNLLSSGTIAIGHTAAAGTTTGLSIADGTATLLSRSNASWTVSSGDGLATTTSGTLGMQVVAGMLYPAGAATDLRLCRAADVVGTHVAAGGSSPEYTVERAGLSLANLTQEPFYVGSTAPTSIAGQYISVATGNWNTGSTWDVGTVPTAGASVVIMPGHTVTVNTAAAVAKKLLIAPSGTLQCTSGTLSVDTAVDNKGTVNITGGNLKLGPDGGSDRAFLSAGTLKVSAGTLTVNGMLSVSNNFTPTGVTFQQTGGAIVIDGNSATNGSVPFLAQFYLNAATVSATGGTLTIVDPHTATISNSFEASNATFGTGHTVIFGDGASTASGGTAAFRILTSAFRFGNVTVNGSPSGANRRVYDYSTGGMIVLGNLDLHNANARFDADDLYLNGHLTADTLTTFNTTGVVNFCDYSGTSIAASANAQTVSGAGLFQNNVTAPTANFTDLKVNNTSAAGVTLNIGDCAFSGTLAFVKGILHIANNKTLTSLTDYTGSLAGTGTGWVAGRFKLKFSTTAATNAWLPIGDNSYYTPVYFQPGAPLQSAGSIAAAVVATDHPNISTSLINPAKSVNRYYVLDTADGFMPGSSSPEVTLYWAAPDMDAAANPANFAVRRRNSAGVWNNVITESATSISQKTLPGLHIFSGAYQIGELNAAPVILQQPATQIGCTGSPVSFTIAASAATAYQWQVYTGGTWINLSNNATYSGVFTDTLTINSPTAAMDGYQYRCKVTNSFGTTTSAGSLLDISSTLTPAITIAATPGTTICAGVEVTFTASLTNGGASPALQWKKNGVVVATGLSFSSATLSTGDIVTATLTSSSPCAAPATATSNTVTMTVNNVVTPAVTISTGATTVCAGASVVFTAAPTSGGSTPGYQWKKNGVTVGTNQSTYTVAPQNGDVITCVLTSNAACATTASATSNALTMTVTTPVTPAVSMAASPAGALCSGTPVTFTATAVNGGATPQYLWYKNGVSTGVTTSTYTLSSPASNDAVYCVLTSSVDCYTQPTATSSTNTLTVLAAVNPAVSIAATPGTMVCAGTAVTFQATAVDGGASPAYQWYLNGGLQSATGATYSTSALANGDVVYAKLTSSAACAPATPASSNQITMTINPVVTPTAAVSASANPVCQGMSVAFSASTNITGAAYQWTVNGANAGTGATYSYVPANGDVVKCVVSTPAGSCYTQAVINSNIVTMSVTAPAVPLALIAGDSDVCAGTAVMLTATTNATGGSYQWTVNGVNSGSNAATFSYTPQDNDLVSCTVTPPSAGCFVAGQAASNTISMEVNPLMVPTLTISGPAQAPVGSTVALTADVQNAGASYSITWKKNGATFATTTTPGTSYTKTAGTDVVTAVVTPQGTGCYTNDASNDLTITTQSTGTSTLPPAPAAIQVHPNPFHDVLRISNLPADAEVVLVNAAGQTVQRWVLVGMTRTQELQIGDLAEGMYFLTILDREGRSLLKTPVQKH